MAQNIMMKALSKTHKEPGLWLEQAPIPTIAPHEVLVKIRKTAICGTDVHIYNWDAWAQKTIPAPMIIGHEFVGNIVQKGNLVTNFEVGDRVSGEGHIACERCRNCRSGRQHLCLENVGIGVTRQGCFAEYLSIPATNLCHIPDSITDKQAAILDPLGNATHVALSFDLVGENVLITGAGPTGMLATAIARHVGARHIVVTDINDHRLTIAKQLGATYAVNSKEKSLSSVMRELGMKTGFDVGFEMSGNPLAFNAMLANMTHDGKIALLGFLPDDMQINWNHIILKGLVLKGIYGREMFETWHKMIAMLQSGLNVDVAITHEFPVDDFQKAFDTMRSGQSGKVILDWT